MVSTMGNQSVMDVNRFNGLHFAYIAYNPRNETYQILQFNTPNYTSLPSFLGGKQYEARIASHLKLQTEQEGYA